jgi:DNA invertase Pin-like site-specific DNA recombinase
MGRGGESFISPDEQRTRIEAWAVANGHEIIDWFEDLDVSGGKMDRPAFVLAMATLEAKHADGVVVAKLDRFARTLVGALDALKRIESFGAQFASVADNFDTTTANGRLVLNMMLVLAEFERERITEGWDSTVQNAVARGVWPHGTPFGYLKGDDKRLVPHPTNASYLQGIFERRLTGDTWADIARWLNIEGVKPGRAEQWTGVGVRDCIRNEVYLGVVWGLGYRNEDAHEALIGKGDWLAAQNVNGVEQGANVGGIGRLLSGLVRCGGCGYSMRASSYGPKGKQKGQYTCKRYHGSGSCPAPANVNASTIEPWVEAQFFEYVANTSSVYASDDAPELHGAEQAVADAEADLRLYRDDVNVQRALGPAMFVEGLTARANALTEAQGALDEARRRIVGVDLPDEATLREIWPDLTLRERRRMLGLALDFVAVRKGKRGDMDDRGHVYWKGTGPTDLSRKGHTVPMRQLDW